jgi:hypothetical protein
MKQADQAFPQRRGGGYIEGAAEPDHNAGGRRTCLWTTAGTAGGGTDAGHGCLLPAVGSAAR